ncbi:uncharacterized protein FFB20_12908 [Fusarium fujikuroi]|nr:uncharacterized protein FFB20_12908 [Fusarium fujikuroi]
MSSPAASSHSRPLKSLLLLQLHGLIWRYFELSTLEKDALPKRGAVVKALATANPGLSPYLLAKDADMGRDCEGDMASLGCNPRVDIVRCWHTNESDWIRRYGCQDKPRVAIA